MDLSPNLLSLVLGVSASLIATLIAFNVKKIWRWIKHKPSVITGEIYDDNMPSTDNGALVGREETLSQLAEAWNDQETRVLALVAWGGVGKTSVINRWCEELKRDVKRAPRRIYCWSFANQGLQGAETSSSAFFTHALQWFGSEKTRFSTEHEKGEYLAKRINQQQTLLVLDGLEVFQYLSADLLGQLRDPAMFALLRALGRDNAGLCVVATRESLEARLLKTQGVRNLPLENLSESAGVNLLKNIGCSGRKHECLDAVREYEGHAYSLTLLAHYLVEFREGDIRRRDTLPPLSDWMGQQSILRIFEAYEDELRGKPELLFLYLLSVFEEDVEESLLVWLVQQLENDEYSDFAILKPILRDDEARITIIASLQQSSLVMGTDALLGLHPVARQFFRQRFELLFPRFWKAAHLALYEYYKCLPDKEYPDTLEEMQPLFKAVAHGCNAGMHKQSIRLYLDRIQRGDEHYLIDKLGEFNEDV